MKKGSTGAAAVAIPTAGMVRKGHAFPTGEKSTSAVMLEKIVPAEVQLSQPFEYYLQVTNLTDHALEDVVVSDRLPASFKVTSTEPSLQSNKGGDAQWVFEKLAANEQKVIRIKGQADQLGTIGSCATVEYASRVCSTINVVRAALKLEKIMPESALLCDEIPVEYVVTNTGNGTARNIIISESLPRNLETLNRRPVRFDVGELAPGESRRFTTKVRAGQKGSFKGNANLKADGNLTAKSSTTTTTVREPRLEISHTGPEKSFLGRSVSYEITVANVGDGMAGSVRIEDIIPTSAEVVKISDAGKAARGKLTWNLGNLKPNDKRTVSVTLRDKTATSMRATATATAKCTAPVDAGITTKLVGIPAILLEVVDVEDPVIVGENETYEIRVTNQGTAPGTNIVIACTLEEPMEFISASGATKGVHRSGQVVFEPLKSLAPKAATTFRVVVKATAEGDARFKVRMTSDQIKRPVDETEATNFYK